MGMADGFSPFLDPKVLKQLNADALRLKNTFVSTADELNKKAKNLSQSTGENYKTYVASSSAAQKLSNKLQGLTKNQLKGLDLRIKFQKDLDALEAESVTRSTLIEDIQDKVNSVTQQKTTLEEELITKKEVQLDLEKELARAKARGADESELTGLQEQIDLTKEQRKEIISTIEVLETDPELGAYNQLLEILQDQQTASDELIENFEALEDVAGKIEKVNPFKEISGVVKQVPFLRKAFDGLADAVDVFNDELVESNSRAKALSKTLLDVEIPKGGGVGGFLGGLTKAKGIIPDLAKGVAGIGVKFGVEGFKRFDEATVKLEKNLNVSTVQAAKLQQKFIDIAQENIGLTATDLTEALSSANAALGTTADLSADTLRTHATLTKQMGFSSDEASKLMKFAMSTGQSFEEFTNEAIGTVKVLNAQNKTAIDYKGILKDINNTSNAVKMSIQAQGYGLADAAYQAKKMGLSLDKMDSIAGNLLDFEQSIAKELEAELLLGQDLNLEKARQMALDGDLIGMSKELQKQGVTAAKFTKMNRIEQESIAAAMGMSRDEMANMFTEQKALNQLQVEGAKNLDDAVNQKYDNILAAEKDLIAQAQEKAKKEQEQILASSKTKEEKAIALSKLQAEEEKRIANIKSQTQQKLDKLATDSGKKELVNKRKAQTAEEKFREGQIKMQDQMMKAMDPEIFAGMKGAMDKVSTAIPGLTKAIEYLTIAIGVMQGLSFVRDSYQFLKNMKGSGGVMKNLTKNVNSLTGSLDDAAGAARGIVSQLDNAAGAATSTASNIKNVKPPGSTASVADDVTKAGAKGGGFFSKMLGGAKNLAGKAAGAVKGVAGKAAGAVSNVVSKAAGGVKSVAGKVGGAVSNVAGKVGEVAGKLNPKQAIGKFLKGPNLAKFVKKIPYLGQLIGPAIETYMIAKTAGSGADPRMVGNAVVNAIGGLGGGILGSVLGSFVPVPGVGTFVGGVLGDMAGRWVADKISENVDTSGIGQMAIKVFGPDEEQITPTPQMAEEGSVESSPDMAADFISRPGQPIQKFRPDDIVIGATNPMGGGSGDNARTVELLERLVAAVEKGGVINMDGNKVGTILGMSSYRTQ